MPSQQDDKRQAAREVIDILHEISQLLVRFQLHSPFLTKRLPWQNGKLTEFSLFLFRTPISTERSSPCVSLSSKTESIPTRLPYVIIAGFVVREQEANATRVIFRPLLKSCGRRLQLLRELSMAERSQNRYTTPLSPMLYGVIMG